MIGDDERRNELYATLHTLESEEGADQELISLFIPPDKPIPEVTGYLKDEFSRAETIPVQHALSSILTGLKKYDELPGNGLALFCGAGPEEPGRDPRCTIIEPPEPLTIYLYRRSTKFELEPLQQMLDEKNLYGLLVLDLSGAWWGFLRGDRLEPAGNSTSSIPAKQRKGGQSSARFQRLREIAVNEFYSRVGNHASEAFMSEKIFFLRFRGVLIGGPGMTKEDFLAGHFLHHEIQKRVIGLFDVTTTGARGLAELAEHAKAAISKEDTTDEKYLLGRFREERAKSDGLAVSGEERVRKNLTANAVGTLLLSSGLRRSHRRITCQKCGHADERTIPLEPGMDIQGILARTCRICDAPIIVDEGVDITEELTRLADKGGAKTKIIAENFDEGSQFLVESGGIGAILRYRTEF
jgi:peptide chain release factor subunit 1